MCSTVSVLNLSFICTYSEHLENNGFNLHLDLPLSVRIWEITLEIIRRRYSVKPQLAHIIHLHQDHTVQSYIIYHSNLKTSWYFYSFFDFISITHIHRWFLPSGLHSEQQQVITGKFCRITWLSSLVYFPHYDTAQHYYPACTTAGRHSCSLGHQVLLYDSEGVWMKLDNLHRLWTTPQTLD